MSKKQALIELSDQQKQLLKLIAEGNLTNVFDKKLYDNKLVKSDGKITGKGLAFAVGYCGASISKHFEKFPHSKKMWSEMLSNIEPYISGPQELDNYFKANMQTYVEFDYFREDGWFKDYSNLTLREIAKRRVATIERFLELNKVPGSFANEIMEMTRRQLLDKLDD